MHTCKDVFTLEKEYKVLFTCFFQFPSSCLWYFYSGFSFWNIRECCNRGRWHASNWSSVNYLSSFFSFFFKWLLIYWIEKMTEGARYLPPQWVTFQMVATPEAAPDCSQLPGTSLAVRRPSTWALSLLSQAGSRELVRSGVASLERVLRWPDVGCRYHSLTVLA